MAERRAARARPEEVRVSDAGSRATPVDRAGKAGMLITVSLLEQGLGWSEA